MVKIDRVIDESVNIRTFTFEDPVCQNARPGQFVMVWLPGVGEFPMSLSLTYPEGKSSIVVKAMGLGSTKLFASKKGVLLGIRGPYGNSFEILDSIRRILLVGGGTGIAPIISLAAILKDEKRKNLDSVLVIGARTKDEIPFLSAARNFLGPENVFTSTDDGSCGFHGFAHQKVEKLMKNFKIDLLCACGPEAMLYQIYEIAQKNSIAVQFSLERIMKCGIAICGSCSIEDLVLCRDGPVLNQRQLERVSKEFGHFERAMTGRLVPK
jgi:dihydroorotate dehydrogenase electron transfer subunit